MEPTDVLDRYFRVTERGSTVAREVRGGVVTFVTMAYIVILNPLIIGTSADINGDELGIPQVAAVTALVAGVMTLVFGLVVNYPFAIATGLGINALLAVSITQETTWPQAMGLVVLNGLIVMVLVLTGVRQAVFDAVPGPLKAAIAVGIGLFIAFIGFVDAGFVRSTGVDSPPVQLGVDGSLATWPTVVFAFGLLLVIVLLATRVRGAILIGIAVTAVVAIVLEAIVGVGQRSDDNPGGWNLGYPAMPEQVFELPDLSLVGQFSFGFFGTVPALTIAVLVFTLVLTDFFDTIGTMTGLGKEAGFIGKDGKLPRTGRALFVDATSAVAGGAASSSSNTMYIESASGIADGARTGLANVVTGLLFLGAMFVTPLYSVIPIEAAAAALVVVGALMMMQIREIDFSELRIAIPAFLTIVVMPFTFSIANGIGAGFISWALLHLVTGRAREVHPLMWVVAVIFAVYFAVG